jgi:hypothetical protein
MRGASTGPIGALLVVVPLLSIPVLAVFGVPTFGPMAARRRDASAEFSADLADEPAVNSRSTRDRRRKAKPEPTAEEWDSNSANLSAADHGEFSSADEDDRGSSIRARGKRLSAATKKKSKPPASMGRGSKLSPPPNALDGWEAETGGKEVDLGDPESGVDEGDAWDSGSPDDDFDNALAANTIDADDESEQLDEDGFNPRLLTEAYAAARKKSAANSQPGPSKSRNGAASGRKTRPESRTAELFNNEQDINERDNDEQDNDEQDNERPASRTRSAKATAEKKAKRKIEAEPPSTLQDATRRLTRLGIKAEDYQLSGNQTDGYTFKCVVRADGRKRTFTATADDDIDAVADVLLQIEQYQARTTDRE